MTVWVRSMRVMIKTTYMNKYKRLCGTSASLGHVTCSWLLPSWYRGILCNHPREVALNLLSSPLPLSYSRLHAATTVTDAADASHHICVICFINCRGRWRHEATWIWDNQIRSGPAIESLSTGEKPWAHVLQLVGEERAVGRILSYPQESIEQLG